EIDGSQAIHAEGGVNLPGAGQLHDRESFRPDAAQEDGTIAQHGGIIKPTEDAGSLDAFQAPGAEGGVERAVGVVARERPVVVTVGAAVDLTDDQNLAVGLYDDAVRLPVRGT